DRNLVVDEARPQPQRGSGGPRGGPGGQRGGSGGSGGGWRREGQAPGPVGLRGLSFAVNYSSCEESMNRPGVPAPAFVTRIGEIVDRRRGAEFQELKSRTLINRLTGTGMPFGWTVNPFRGCEFGCRYCYARTTHEYLGPSEPDDFEERIYVRRADLGQLVADLVRARDSGQEIAIGAATDPYQPAETRFEITRSVLRTMTRVPGLRV